MAKFYSRQVLLAFFLVWFIESSAQQTVWAPDSNGVNNPNFRMDRYHEILRYHDPFMYLVFPVVEPVKDRPLPLAEGEGKNGYFLEGKFAHRFVGYKGKYYSPAFLQRLRLTLDVDLQSRVTRDKSSPLLPLNNKFGIGLDMLLTSLAALSNSNTTTAWASLQLHHFSNGQTDSFFIEGPVFRNNYTGGDFSTNYFRGMLHFALNAHQRSMFKLGAGFQREISGSGVFARSSEMKTYYGDNRWLLDVQLTRQPRLVTRHYENRSTIEQDTITIEKRRHLSYRAELEYISGDLSNFPGDNKYRLGWHNYLNYMPSVTNEVGFILHTYLGRDYLNIRFDDIVFVIGAGLYVKFNSK